MTRYNLRERFAYWLIRLAFTSTHRDSERVFRQAINRATAVSDPCYVQEGVCFWYISGRRTDGLVEVSFGSDERIFGPVSVADTRRLQELPMAEALFELGRIHVLGLDRDAFRELATEFIPVDANGLAQAEKIIEDLQRQLAAMTASRDAFRELAYRNREDSAHELARKLDRTEGRLQVKESNLQYYHDYLDGLQRFSREGEKDMSLAGIWIAAEDIEEVLKRWY